MDGGYAAVIGLECHAQLRTATKLFCACPVGVDLPPNSAVCPICLAHPGTMPVLQTEAVQLATRAAVALSCTVHPVSTFARKHYFYPDLPKGFQITQHERPLATGGRLHTPHGVYTITRIHLEEDAGRMIHAADASLVDWNRAGVPLIEIVGAPDIESPEAAEVWLRLLHRVLVEGGICTGDLERGHLRCDANVSVHRRGGPSGARVEVKNLNSFRAVAQALAFEIDRQAEVLAHGGAVLTETRRWTGKKTVAIRVKEDGGGYRYLDEFDLPPLRVSPEEVQAAIDALPAVPLDVYVQSVDRRRVEGAMARYGLGEADIAVILGDPEAERYFTEAVARGGEARAMCTLVQSEILRRLHGEGVGRLEPIDLVEARQLLIDGHVNRDGERAVLAFLAQNGGRAVDVVTALGLGRMDDEAELRRQLQRLLREHPGELARYQAGSTGLLGFFVGRLMAVTGRRADPVLVHRLVRAALDGSGSEGGSTR